MVTIPLPSRTAVILSFVIVILLPILTIVLAWLCFHTTIAAILTVLVVFEYIFIWSIHYFHKPTNGPEIFSGQIDHVGGMAGVTFGIGFLVNSAVVQPAGWVLFLAMLSIPCLGMICSVLWQWSESVYQRWRWMKVS